MYSRHSPARQLQGEHEIQFDYMETSGDAQMKMLTTKIPECAPQEFQVDFFRKTRGEDPDSKWFSTSCVEKLSTKKGGLKLPKRLPMDEYSMVAKGSIELNAGTWRF